MSALEGKRVLILGGSSGIGLATARATAEMGASVTIASRNTARLQCALGVLPTSVRSAMLDLCDDTEVENFFKDGVVWDHLVISGAETPIGSVRAMPLADAYAAMDSKFWGAYCVARSAQLSQHGSITLVSGILSVRPRAGIGVQSAINAAVEALGVLWRSSLRQYASTPSLLDLSQHLSGTTWHLKIVKRCTHGQQAVFP